MKTLFILRLKRIKNTSFVMNDTQERGGTFSQEAHSVT